MRVVTTIDTNIPATTVAISASAASSGSLRLRVRAWTKDRGVISTINRPERRGGAIEWLLAWSATEPQPLMKILIVDDEAGTRLMVATAVERLGHARAPGRATATRAGRRSSYHRPEVVITDWAMPGLDGTQLIARIRAADGDYAYIMLLSGRVDEGASREAMRAGADDVLSKPPDPAELERGLIAAERITTMHRRMRDDARRDPLTGAGSRLRLDEDLGALCARVARYGHAYCVAMIGIEPAGDDAVLRAGEALAAQIRSGDVLYRSGLAQFVVLLPEQGLETANLAATRLREAAQSAAPPGNDGHRRHGHDRGRAGAGRR